MWSHLSRTDVSNEVYPRSELFVNHAALSAPGYLARRVCVKKRRFRAESSQTERNARSLPDVFTRRGHPSMTWESLPKLDEMSKLLGVIMMEGDCKTESDVKDWMSRLKVLP